MDSQANVHKAGEPVFAIGNKIDGGTGGKTFEITNSLLAVKTVTVWIDRGAGGWKDRDVVKAIKVEWTDGTTRTKGNQTGTTYSFTFDKEEKVTKMSLWTGDLIDKISLTTEDRGPWSHGGTGGVEHTQDVGNGILLGFKGSASSDELVNLGAIFKEATD